MKRSETEDKSDFWQRFCKKEENFWVRFCESFLTIWFYKNSKIFSFEKSLQNSDMIKDEIGLKIRLKINKYWLVLILWRSDV